MEKVKEWVCSMHPSVRSDKPGKCPICGMKLIPAVSDKPNPNKITLSPEAVKTAEVITVEAKRAKAVFELPLSGRIEYDETLKDTISANFNCRVEKLYVNYLGLPVHKGQHIARLFGADIAVAKRELKFAIKSLIDARKTHDKEKIASAEEVLNSARNKLHSWGFLPKQVLEMAQSGELSPEIDILAPVSGVVIQNNLREGRYFKRGDKLLSGRYLGYVADA